MSTTPPPADRASPDGRFSQRGRSRSTQQFSFSIDSDVRGLGVHGAYVLMEALTNKSGHDEFDELLGHALDDLDDSIGQGYDLRTDPILAGYRQLHGAVGRSNRDHVASSENLHRLVKMNGTIPRVNLLVDVHNLVSLKTRLAISAHDLSKVHGNVRLSLTTGRERFFPLSSQESKVVYPGEYAYVDEADEIICRMDTRQAATTRPDLSTSECFSIIQGNPAASPAYVRQAASELVALTTYFCGGFARTISAD
jgi:DNA/RNA-binding domain of Phe-tRNA-synthetase-like protein